MKIKLFTLLFAIVASVGAYADTDGDIVASGTCGDNLTWSFNSKIGKLIILGSGEMNDYAFAWENPNETAPWYEYVSDIVSVDLSSEITKIGNYAFQDCNVLKDVVIPKSVQIIGDDAFAWCESVTSIVIPENVTSIGEGAFYMSGLTSVIIPENVNFLGEWAFADCWNLTSATILGNIVDLNVGMFQNCNSLKSIVLPEKLKSFGIQTFQGCDKLLSVTIPESVSEIGQNAFSGCKSLTSITCYALTPPTLSSYRFYDFNYDIPLYVPDESIGVYVNTEQWKDFDIRPISALETGLKIAMFDNPSMKVRKVIENGVLYLLLPDGNTYNVLGAEVK